MRYSAVGVGVKTCIKIVVSWTDEVRLGAGEELGLGSKTVPIREILAQIEPAMLIYIIGKFPKLLAFSKT